MEHSEELNKRDLGLNFVTDIDLIVIDHVEVNSFHIIADSLRWKLSKQDPVHNDLPISEQNEWVRLITLESAVLTEMEMQNGCYGIVVIDSNH